MWEMKKIIGFKMKVYQTDGSLDRANGLNIWIKGSVQINTRALSLPTAAQISPPYIEYKYKTDSSKFLQHQSGSPKTYYHLVMFDSWVNRSELEILFTDSGVTMEANRDQNLD